ncbi:ufm1-specific protease 2-like [Centruroides sculpturatus]|uniref:ufm1-specific protease 2-like n=2 Tax=Centruroides sculpturatus TaxID=218467 RepID=UPI000C6E949F|nr:ufm1-specific protease 2-like [Centruroides sculpturatus]
MEEIIITESLRNNLQNLINNESANKEKTGIITGSILDGTIICLGCSLTDKHLPVGIQVVGSFFQMLPEEVTEILVQQTLENYVTNYEELSNIEYGILLFVSKIPSSKDINIEARLYSPSALIIGDSVPITISDTILQKFLLLRARGEIELSFEIADNEKEFQGLSLTSAIEKLQSVFSDFSTFHLRDSLLLLLKNDQMIDGLTCCNLKDCIEASDNYQRQKQSKKQIFDLSKQEVLNFDILLQTTGDQQNFTPVIHYQRKVFQSVTIPLFLDVMAVVQETLPISKLVNMLMDGIVHQLDEIKLCLLKFKQGTEYFTPVSYYFWPITSNYPISITYPHSLNDKQLESYRKELHQQLLLPLDKPLLRLSNKKIFINDLNEPYLTNTHVGLASSGIQNGKPSIIWGTYTYHHYMQDRIDDNGWGCAYRSLQTIISWFRHQGYTDVAIPTHKEIQQALVTLGDKPSSFVGSKKWIGSQEVSYCLNHFIGVTSKIMFVSSGSELANKGRELSSHFSTQGTPIMIGGGMLAHTILGVDFNESSGELKFLILDPHYTGSEDINIIQNKGWCGWKDPSFWDASAFYNLCMPQRPIEI